MQRKVVSGCQRPKRQRLRTHVTDVDVDARVNVVEQVPPDVVGILINDEIVTSSGLTLHSGNVMNVHMTYDGTTLTWTITDPTAGKSFTALATVNIPSVVGGNTALLGFTAGTGGLSATQQILTWSYR
jgi:hypothetical protein